MKNESILPHTLVPANIRLEVYQEALAYLLDKDTKELYGSHTKDGLGLRLLLPTLLWGLNHYNSKAPNGEPYSWRLTPQMFPELNEDILDRIWQVNDTDLIDERILALNLMISRIK